MAPRVSADILGNTLKRFGFLGFLGFVFAFVIGSYRLARFFAPSVWYSTGNGKLCLLGLRGVE